MSRQTPLEAAEAFLERRQDRPYHMAINEDDQWEDDDITYGTVRALVAQVRLDEERLADHDRLVAENETMKVSLTAAIKILRPVWDVLITNIVPLWNAIEPLIEPVEPGTGSFAARVRQLSHGDVDICEVCDHDIEYVVETAADGGVFRSWMHVEPHLIRGNEHDAKPVDHS